MGPRRAEPAEPSAPMPSQASAPRRHLVLVSGTILGLWVLCVLWMLPHPPTSTPAASPRATDIRQGLGRAREPLLDTDIGTTTEPMTTALSRQLRPPSPQDARLADLLTRSSLRGSEIDGQVRLGADGRLLMDAELVRFFEYHLALLGELDLTTLRALLAGHVAQRLNSDAVPIVLAAFERYLGLRQALNDLSPGLTLRQTIEARTQLEREWFGEDAEAMFGEARAYDSRTAQRLEASRPEEHSDTGHGQSAHEREARSALLAEEQTRQFDALGLAPAERQAERTALWGAEAAARLDALDAERAAWESRLRTYAAERARMIEEGTATSAQLEALRQRSFDARERLRVEALERVGAL